MRVPERPRAINFLDLMVSHLQKSGYKRSPEVQVMKLDEAEYIEFLDTYKRYKLFIHPDTPTLVWDGFIFHFERYIPTDNAIPALIHQVKVAIEN